MVSVEVRDTVAFTVNAVGVAITSEAIGSREKEKRIIEGLILFFLKCGFI